jgi:hypothetical protein
MRWIAAVAILFSTTAFAQLTQTSERIDVSVIEVDAVVLDASGKPVTGLKPRDFELRIGGRRTPVTNFYEVNRRAEAGCRARQYPHSAAVHRGAAAHRERD